LTLVFALLAKNADALLDRPAGEKIQSILSYIDSHITDRHLLTTEKIAGAFFISKGYFNQYFHKATGSPYKKYVNEYSLNLIAQQLVNSDKTLSNLAAEFGYSDESHLSNAFKAHFHQTPGSFRKHKQEAKQL
jgi:AraC family transcriptional regulator, L-rhamnose operon regulatory protein RhaS